MGARDELIVSIKAVRIARPGVTQETVGSQKPLMDILDTADPGEAVERLSASVQRLVHVEDLNERNDAQGLRAALGIELPLQRNVTARRRLAKETGLFVGSDRAQFDAEERAIERLADLLLNEAAKREADAFQESGAQVLAAAGHSAPFQPTTAVALDKDDQPAAAATDDVDDLPSPPAEPENVGFIATLRGVFGKRPLPTTEREYALLVYPFVALVVVVTVVITLGYAGKFPSWPRAKNSPDKVTSATVPSSATVTTTPQIDNSRGWGPARKTFTMGHPATYPVLDSITDNPGHGDERNFVQCKDASQGNERYADELVAQDGHTYDCFALVVNDIAPNLDSIASPDTGGNVAAKLQDARLRVWFPENHTYNPGLVVILSASNTNPSAVWDSCNFVAPRPVSLRYVLGSARLHTNGTPNNVGAPLPGSEDAPIHDKGALLGDDGRGLVGQHGGYVIFQMSVTLG